VHFVTKASLHFRNRHKIPDLYSDSDPDLDSDLDPTLHLVGTIFMLPINGAP